MSLPPPLTPRRYVLTPPGGNPWGMGSPPPLTPRRYVLTPPGGNPWGMGIPPPLTPPPGAGNFLARFFGPSPRKTAPLRSHPPGGNPWGMSLPPPLTPRRYVLTPPGGNPWGMGIPPPLTPRRYVLTPPGGNPWGMGIPPPLTPRRYVLTPPVGIPGGWASPPPLTPTPRGGELARFFGPSPRKTAPLRSHPSRWESLGDEPPPPPLTPRRYVLTPPGGNPWGMGIPPTLTPPPGARNFLWAVFRGRLPAKNGPIDFSPFPGGIGKGKPSRRAKSGLRPDFARLKKLPALGGGVGGGGTPSRQSP